MKYKNNYFGYVYEWLNTVNGMKYRGSHYGSIDDSYKGSSNWFLSAYNKRPDKFIIRILEYIQVDDKKQILICEQKWLDKIKDIKSNKEYYNLKNEAQGGWSHISLNQIKQRSKTLIKKHNQFGLSIIEKKSYISKIQTRLQRWNKKGYSKKELNQHNSYSIKVKVITPKNEIIFYNSLAKASKQLLFDANYGAKMTKQHGNYKEYQIFKMSKPIVNCRRK